MEYKGDMMKQLTKEQAIKIAQSGIWEKWSDLELFHVQIRQDRLFCDFGRFQEATEKVLGRPVYTHEFGLNRDGLIQESLGGKQPTLQEIMDLFPKDKIIIALIT